MRRKPTEASSSPPDDSCCRESFCCSYDFFSHDCRGEHQLPMYRLYNRYNGEHLFTSSSSEAQSLISLGWTGESVAWFTPNSGNAVFRLYNRYSGDHHYTTSRDEYNSLVSLGWSGEGVGFYLTPRRQPWCTVSSTHMSLWPRTTSTTAQSEYDYLGSIGGVRRVRAGMVPLCLLMAGT